MLHLFRRVLAPIDSNTRIVAALGIAQTLIPASGEIIAPIAETDDGAIALGKDDPAALYAALTQAQAQGVRVRIVPWRGAHARDLATLASRYKADVMALAPKDPHHLELVWYPPRTAAALGSLPIPILIYPPEAPEQGLVLPLAAAHDEAPETTDNTIMVALDDGAAIESALAFAVGWTRQIHGALLLAEVMPSAGQHGASAPARERALRQLAQAQKHIERLAGPLPLHVQARLLIGNPAEQLLKCAEDEAVALIVTGVHHHARTSRFFTGDVATNLIRRAGLPVLLIPLATASIASMTTLATLAPYSPHTAHAPGTDEVVCVSLVSEDSRA